MKIILMVALTLLCTTSFSQKIISFNTSYYGNKYPYTEMYICSDSNYLEEYKKNKLENTPQEFTLPGRQKFILADEKDFESLCNYLLKYNEDVEQGDFPQPFGEIYYVKIIDFAEKKVDIIMTFGTNKQKAFSFFNTLKIYLADDKNIKSNSSLMSHLSVIVNDLR